MDENVYINRRNAIMREIKEKKRLYAELGKKIELLEAEREELQSQYNLFQIRQNRNSAVVEFAEQQFEWSEDVQKLLKDKFKFKEFRSKQLAAINGTLSKRDVLLVMPTGGGKSLVYQLPAIYRKHITLVISPLISLIDDQIRSLRENGIEAATLNSSTDKEEKKRVYEAISNLKPNLKLLYVTPEWFTKNKVFLNTLQKCHEKGYLDRVVVDEVHCCSTWGHDFRPDYGMLGLCKSLFPDVPLLGLTATATMHTLVDVQETLNLKNCLIITSPFNRPNLYYKVVQKPEKKDVLIYLYNLIKKEFDNKSGLIYTTTTVECDEISSYLREKNIEARAYYANLDDKVKKKVHEYWFQNKVQIVVATLAFGMGIDKPDVRFVVHYCIPKSLENYYQESGRAGRDGQPAKCILLFNLNDHLRNVAMSTSQREAVASKQILAYSLNVDRCRRQLIAEHFEDSWRQTDCVRMCDNCKKPKTVIDYDISTALTDILQLIQVARVAEIKLTLKKLIQAWFQKGEKKLRHPSVKPPKCSEKLAEYIVAHLIYTEYLNIERSFNMYTAVPYISKGIKAPGKITMTQITGFKYPVVGNGEPPEKKLKTDF